MHFTLQEISSVRLSEKGFYWVNGRKTGNRKCPGALAPIDGGQRCRSPGIPVDDSCWVLAVCWRPNLYNSFKRQAMKSLDGRARKVCRKI